MHNVADNKPTLRLILADDHTLFRDALALYLRRSAPHLDLALTENLDGVFEMLAATPQAYDLILLDLRMPGMFGLLGLQKLRHLYPHQSVAILSGTADPDDVQAALKLGAVAYFPKTMKSQSLLSAIDLVCGGDTYIATDAKGELQPSYLVDAPLDQAKHQKILQSLTDREKQILLCLTKGKSNQQIADDYKLQLPTIKLHVGSIMRKLDAKNRTQAAMIGQKLSLTDSL